MQKDTLDLSKRLISISSVKDDTKSLENVLGVVEKLKIDTKVAGFSKNNIPSLLYYNTPTLPKKFKVILNAHLDVVPAKQEQFKPKVVGDKLFGRGAIDMKAATAVEILVYKELAKKVNYPLGLQLVTDEEVGGFDGTKYQTEKGVRADFVIAGEQTDLNISNKAKGIVWAKISCRGKSAHGAHPWDGENAVEKMNKFVCEKLYKAFPIPAKEAWVTTANLAKIESSNSAFNKVPDDCTISVDFRYVPEEKSQIVRKIKSIVPKGFALEVVVNEPSQYTPQNNPFAKNLMQKIQEAIGKKAKFISDHGASDIRYYDGVSVPGVCFGPVGGGLHTDNEWVSISSLEEYYKILKDFLLGVPGEGVEPS